MDNASTYRLRWRMSSNVTGVSGSFQNSFTLTSSNFLLPPEVNGDRVGLWPHAMSKRFSCPVPVHENRNTIAGQCRSERAASRKIPELPALGRRDELRVIAGQPTPASGVTAVARELARLFLESSRPNADAIASVLVGHRGSADNVELGY